jgi:molecular chaperone DnaK
MYKQQGAPGGEAGPQADAGASQGGAPGGDEKVVDADFEEVDENKKRGSGG